jgi:hypothetical protein
LPQSESLLQNPFSSNLLAMSNHPQATTATSRRFLTFLPASLYPLFPLLTASSFVFLKNREKSV